jgi:hypothetical protein
MQGPYIRIEDTGVVIPLREEVTTVGRGSRVDVQLGDPSVSRLHAEIIRRGPYAYVTDLGLSRNGTRVNGRLVARRVLQDGDVLTFGSARCRMGGLGAEDCASEVELRRPAAPELTRREHDVVTSLCRPALSDEAFVAPATAREIAADLVVTEAAVKQHLLRLYQKFRIPEGANRRVRLANEVVALGLVRPLPPAERPDDTASFLAPAAGTEPASAAPGGAAASTASTSRAAASSADASPAGAGSSRASGVGLIPQQPGPAQPRPRTQAGTRSQPAARSQPGTRSQPRARSQQAARDQGSEPEQDGQGAPDQPDQAAAQRAAEPPAAQPAARLRSAC